MGDDAGTDELGNANPTSPEGSTAVGEDRGPSTGVLAALSIAAFVGLVVVGGAIGLLVGTGDDADGVATARSEQVAVSDVSVDDIAGTLDVPSTTVVEPVLLDDVAASTATQDGQEATTTTAEVDVEVLAVTELGLDLQSSTTVALEPNANDVEFVELPKAVYDRFILEPGELLAINIAANDKIGGQFEAVRPTGLGMLAPGFTLEADGGLSGSGDVCGRWRFQYELLSDNPAVGTSWIDITIEGCR